MPRAKRIDHLNPPKVNPSVTTPYPFPKASTSKTPPLIHPLQYPLQHPIRYNTLSVSKSINLKNPTINSSVTISVTTPPP
ncbi:hypothetical protein VB834_11100 [Limnoraphis robusta Tam1]|uniref:Uncharacterized protein n=1 Tax=Limnoraphis robusta CCNP1315 TaxID=3110306 RepID=A0ABU5UA88_9CYAN|nr:hypothetical protein [Limnoraphis robusta]MEA5497019.1 hypothetical protein [Limnoraphis robusta BA-68 BA1]MEA5523033.1 hypothetical protein [Limnoraphis robusta CCNP1315]MEA5539579.1 hypothetical protein [Limnoraphis robusta Tam1]MEA5546891.1 hypothetical protein [Limnoraphis robusta CCNP1324]